MKILIDARESGTSTGRYIDKLIEYLQIIDQKNQYTVLYKSARLEKKLLRAANFKGVRCDIKEFTFAEQVLLPRQIKKLAPDLIHFGMVQQPLFMRGKKVTTMHDLTTVRFTNPAKNPQIFWIKQHVYAVVNWLIPRTSQHVFTPTNYVRQDVINFAHVKGDNISVTYEAADKISDASEALPALQNTPFIMYVGRPTPHKNLGRLIEVFSDLSKKYPNLKLVLAGRKDVLFLQHEQKVGELGLADKVIFTDFISDGQLRWLYENCQAYVFPSLSEGFGLPGLEAMMHDAPVVSSNATCLPEVYGNAAHYFDPVDKEDMATKISEVLDSPALRRELISAGRKQSAQYSWRRMAEQTLKLYEEV